MTTMTGLTAQSRNMPIYVLVYARHNFFFAGSYDVLGILNIW